RDSELPRSGDNVAGDRRIIVHRERIGHRADRREAPGGGSARAGLHGFGVFHPRLPQVHVHIDETGRYDEAGGVQDLGASNADIWSYAGNTSVLDPHVRDSIEVCRGIDHAAVLDQQGGHYPIIRSRTAIRTAIPFSTWLRITERWKSATSEASSRPRLMGPGCITIASGLARARCSSRSP